MNTASAPSPTSLIFSDSSILGGLPHIRGTRLSVSLMQSLAAVGWSHAEMLDIYPYLTEAELAAALNYQAA
jgi:uncharacterized protein (DUF433 family)